MAPSDVAVERGELADARRNARALDAGPVAQHLDLGPLARAQQSRPIGFDIAPELLALALAHEGALGAKTLDQLLLRQLIEGLPDRGAGDAVFEGELVDRRNLVAHLPRSALDLAAKQRRELDVARHGAAVEVWRARNG